MTGNHALKKQHESRLHMNIHLDRYVVCSHTSVTLKFARVCHTLYNRQLRKAWCGQQIRLSTASEEDIRAPERCPVKRTALP